MTSIVVVDSSVAIKWFVPEVYTPEALQLYSEWHARRIECAAPDLLFVECANILWKKRRQGTMSSADSAKHMQALVGLPFDVTPSRRLMTDALQIAVLHDRTAYDSTYLALANALRCTLITADDRLANAVAPHFFNVIKLSDWKPSSPPDASSTPRPPTSTPPTP